MSGRTGNAPPFSVLVFTPTPTHPPVQGNRQRVFDICRALQSAGAELMVLYYATEGIGSTEAQQMRDAWGEVLLVSPRGFIPRHSLARHPAIDDWFDESISETIRRACLHRHFDACIVNYVWYSRLFDALPSHVVRIIDAHDVFGGRAARFAELGLSAEWFHTSVAEEAKGLDRSDFVIAIQSEEAGSLQGRTRARVRTVGFLSAPDFLPPPRQRPGARLRAGYIGSGNPFNVASMLSLAHAVQAAPDVLDSWEFHVAGRVCSSLEHVPHPFVLHGNAESARAFYNSVDVAINPMMGGTGLKMKSLEALGFGRPLAATKDAMTGIPSTHPSHQLGNPQELVRWLVTLAECPQGLIDEARASRSVFLSYRQTQLGAFRSLWNEICEEIDCRAGQSSRTIVPGSAA